MIIPLNTKERQDLALSIIKLEEGQYSVAIVQIVNEFGLIELPSWHKLLPKDDFTEPIIWMKDFETIKGNDLYDCIEKCIKQVKNAYII